MKQFRRSCVASATRTKHGRLQWVCSHYRPIHTCTYNDSQCLLGRAGRPQWHGAFNNQHTKKDMCMCFCLHPEGTGYDCQATPKKKKKVLFAYFHTNNLFSHWLNICCDAILGAEAWLTSKMMINMLHICFLRVWECLFYCDRPVKKTTLHPSSLSLLFVISHSYVFICLRPEMCSVVADGGGATDTFNKPCDRNHSRQGF